MKICILGWYGTETIGDRAIMVGILSFFNKVFQEIEINLGSLYPFYSKRMLKEDSILYKKVLKKNIKITLFDSQNKKELNEFIKKSDVVIMGGGPIMDIDEVFMIEYAFKKSKKMKKKTGILGCGIGPLYSLPHKKSSINIINNSDLVILRDEQSKEKLIDISNELNIKIEEEKIKVAFDPAVECCLNFLENNAPKTNNEIVINLREYPDCYSKESKLYKINRNLEEFIIKFSQKYNDFIIRLVPMHCFNIGNDDRKFLNYIKLKNNLENIIVQNEILSLQETMKLYMDAKFCIGMRFHSVVFQTLLNGKNYVLDYTEPRVGKISGFLSKIDKNGFYKGRYICLQETDFINMDEVFNISTINNKFIYDKKEIKMNLRIYENEIREKFI